MSYNNNLDIIKINFAAEALKHGYAIRADFTVTYKWLAWIYSFFYTGYENFEIKKAIQAEIQKSHFSPYVEEKYKSLLELTTAFPPEHMADLYHDMLALKLRAQADSDLEKSMLLFNNYDTRLSKGKKPLFSTWIDSWIQFTKQQEGVVGKEKLSALEKCKKLQEQLESKENIIFSKELTYLPVFLPKEGCYTQTIVEVKWNGSECTFKDLSGKISEEIHLKVFAQSEFTELMAWNRLCLQGKSVRRTALPQFLASALKLEESNREFQLGSHFTKPLQVFFGHLPPKAQQTLKVRHKLTLLQSLFHKMPQWMEKTSMRQWLKGSLANLKSSIEKLEDSEQKQSFFLECERILIKIESHESSDLKREIPMNEDSGDLQQKSSLTFGEAFPLPKPIKVKEIKEEHLLGVVEETEVVIPKEMPDLTMSSYKDEDNILVFCKTQGSVLQEWVNAAEKAFQEKNFDALRKICHQFYENFPTVDQVTPFIDNLGWLSKCTSDKMQEGFIDLFECEKFCEDDSYFDVNIQKIYLKELNELIDEKQNFADIRSFIVNNDIHPPELVDESLGSVVRIPGKDFVIVKDFLDVVTQPSKQDLNKPRLGEVIKEIKKEGRDKLKVETRSDLLKVKKLIAEIVSKREEKYKSLREIVLLKALQKLVAVPYERVTSSWGYYSEYDTERRKEKRSEELKEFIKKNKINKISGLEALGTIDEKIVDLDKMEQLVKSELLKRGGVTTAQQLIELEKLIENKTNIVNLKYRVSEIEGLNDQEIFELNNVKKRAEERLLKRKEECKEFNQALGLRKLKKFLVKEIPDLKAFIKGKINEIEELQHLGAEEISLEAFEKQLEEKWLQKRKIREDINETEKLWQLKIFIEEGKNLEELKNYIEKKKPAITALDNRDNLKQQVEDKLSEKWNKYEGLQETYLLDRSEELAKDKKNITQLKEYIEKNKINEIADLQDLPSIEEGNLEKIHTLLYKIFNKKWKKFDDSSDISKLRDLKKDLNEKKNDIKKALGELKGLYDEESIPKNLEEIATWVDSELLKKEETLQGLQETLNLKELRDLFDNGLFYAETVVANSAVEKFIKENKIAEISGLETLGSYNKDTNHDSRREIEKLVKEHYSKKWETFEKFKKGNEEAKDLENILTIIKEKEDVSDLLDYISKNQLNEKKGLENLKFLTESYRLQELLDLVQKEIDDKTKEKEAFDEAMRLGELERLLNEKADLEPLQEFFKEHKLDKVEGLENLQISNENYDLKKLRELIEEKRSEKEKEAEKLYKIRNATVQGLCYAGFKRNLINTWSLPLYRMAYFLIHAQLLELRVVPEDLKYLLKALAVQLRMGDIASFYDKMATFPLRTYELRKVLDGLQNYSADLGEEGGEILETLKTLRKKYSLNEVGEESRKSVHDDVSNPIYNCSDQVARVLDCELTCFLELLVNSIGITQDRREGNNNEDYRTKNNKALEIFYKGLERLQNGERMRLGYTGNTGYSDRGYSITPFEGLFVSKTFFHNKFFGEHVGTAITSFSHLSNPIQNEKIRNFLQQGLLGTSNSLNSTSLGCSYGFGKYQKEEAYEWVEDASSFAPNVLIGENKTQKEITYTKRWIPGLTSRCFQDLQKMQTSSLSRAKNTLLTFKKYPDLFSHIEYGRDFCTLFSLNLFRDFSLYREFCHHPEKIETHFGVIDDLIEYYEKKKDEKVVVFLFEIQQQMLLLLTTTQKQNQWDQNLIEKLTKGLEERFKVLESRLQKTQYTKNTQRSLETLSLAALTYHMRKKTALNIEDDKGLLKLAQQVYWTFSSELISTCSLEKQRKLKAYLKPLRTRFVGMIAKQNGPAQFLTSVGEKISEKGWKETKPGVWVNGNSIFKAETLELFASGEAKGLLPREIRNHPVLREVVSRQELAKEHKLQAVSFTGEHGWSCTFKGKGDVEYSVYFTPKNPSDARVYRKKGEKAAWEQHVTILLQEGEVLSQTFRRALCWRNIETGKVSVENTAGKPINEGNQETFYRQIPISTLGRHSEIFTQLTGESDIEMLKGDKETLISYPYYQLGYRWDGKKKMWLSRNFEGYSLSDKTASSLIKRTSQDKKNPPLFNQSFENYHILEKKSDPNAPKKLLIAPLEYGRNKGLDGIEKYQWKPYQLSENPSLRPTVCVFDIDAEGQLSSKTHSDMLYLSYLLLTQGKYSDALYYMKLGQSVNGYNSRVWAMLAEWVYSYADASPDAIAIKVQFLLLEQKLRVYRKETLRETIDNDERLPLLMLLYTQYRQCQQNISKNLRIGQDDAAFIMSLECRALPRDKEGKIGTPSWQCFSETAKGLIGKEVSEKKVIESYLDSRLNLRLKKHSHKEMFGILVEAESKEVTLDNPIKGSLDSVDLSDYLVKKSRYSSKVDTVVKELRELFKGNTTYADEIGNTLCEDIEYIAEQTYYGINPEADLTVLHKEYKTREKKLLEKEQSTKNQLVFLFEMPQFSSKIQNQNRLKEQEIVVEGLLAEAKICHVNQNWDSLIEKGVIKREQTEKVDQRMDDYLTHRITRKGWTRKREAVEKYLKKTLHEGKLVEILQDTPQYFILTGPARRLYKCIEDAFDITMREGQLFSLILQIKNSNAFRHAGTGSGKTTLARQLIFCLIKLMGKGIPTALTSQDLFEEHHTLLEEGQQSIQNTVFPFLFSRQDVLDEYLLKQIELQLREALAKGNVLDHRSSDILSFKNKFITTILDNREFPLVKKYQDVRKLTKGNLIAHSDELVTTATPMKDYTFAYGSADYLDTTPVVYGACINLFTLISKDEELSPLSKAIKSGQLKRLTIKEFESLLDKVADKLASQFKDVDPKLSAAYLRQKYLKKEGGKEILDYYSKVLSKLDQGKKDLLSCYHRYMEILSQFRCKVVGVSFGRSEDGLSTKPYGGSDYCLESSQRSDLPTTVFETCYDYYSCGASEKSILAYISAKQNEATEEVKDTEKQPEQSQVAQRFSTLFGCSLYANHFNIAELKEKIDSSSEALADFLKATYFKQYSYYSEKIEATSSQLPNQYKVLGGASGSAERVDTLPYQIERNPLLSRQKGDVGKVFFHLINGFDEEKNYIQIDPNQEKASQLGKNLKKGSIFIDTVPFFPGKGAKDIATDLREFTDDPKQNFRFIDKKGNLSSLNTSEEINEETTGVLDQRRTEGTDWRVNGGMISHSQDTQLTTFFQGLARDRDSDKEGGRMIIASEVDWKEQESLYPCLKGTSKLTQILYLLIINEEESLKKLNYMRLLKDIKGAGQNAVDNLFLSVKDKESLDILNNHKDIRPFLVKSTKLDINLLGTPRELISSKERLREIAENEKEKLKKVFEVAKKCQCNPKTIQDAIDFLENWEKNLKIDEKKIPKETNRLDIDIDGIEDLEIEVDVNAEETHEIDLDTEIKEDVDQEVVENIYTREISDVGLEDPAPPLNEAIHHLLGADFKGVPNSFLLPKVSGCTDIFITAHALGFPSGQSIKKVSLADLWLGGSKEPLVMSSSVGFVSAGEKSVITIMSIKDDDLFSQRFVKQEGQEKESKDSWEKPVIEKHFKESDYNRQYWELSEEGYPKEADDQVKRSIVLAKLIYLDCKFSKEDLTIAKTLIESLNIDKGILKERLHETLEKHYIDLRNNHPLLALF